MLYRSHKSSSFVYLTRTSKCNLMLAQRSCSQPSLAGVVQHGIVLRIRAILSLSDILNVEREAPVFNIVIRLIDYANLAKRHAIDQV